MSNTVQQRTAKRGHPNDEISRFANEKTAAPPRKRTHARTRVRHADPRPGLHDTPQFSDTLLYISGRLGSEQLQVVRTALDGRDVVAVELAEVELVDREAVKLLAQAEAKGIELRSCPAYIREWITNERESN